MIKPSDVIGSLGSAIGEVSECAIKVTSFLVSGIAKKASKEDLSKGVESVGKILGETTNLTIKATSKIAGKAGDVLAKKAFDSAKYIKENAFKKESSAEGDALYFYDEEKVIEAHYKIKEDTKD